MADRVKSTTLKSGICAFLAACPAQARVTCKDTQVLQYQGRRQRGGQWCPAPPFEICAPLSRLAPWLLHISNTVFLKCARPSGFLPLLLVFGPPAAISWRRACTVYWMLLFLQLLNNRRRVPVTASWHRKKRPDRMGSLGERRCVELHRTRNADLGIYSTSTHQDIHLVIVPPTITSIQINIWYTCHGDGLKSVDHVLIYDF